MSSVAICRGLSHCALCIPLLLEGYVCPAYYTTPCTRRMFCLIRMKFFRWTTTSVVLPCLGTPMLSLLFKQDNCIVNSHSPLLRAIVTQQPLSRRSHERTRNKILKTTPCPRYCRLLHLLPPLTLQKPDPEVVLLWRPSWTERLSNHTLARLVAFWSTKPCCFTRGITPLD